MSGLLDLFDPNVRRLGLLPYPQGSLSGQKGPVEWSNWVAPQLAVDMAKAIDLPGRAWRGEQISPDDVTKMAMDTMGGSGLLSRAIPTGDVGGLLGINIFHGGPHRWSPEPGFPEGRPRLDKMGTGEGVQAYGHGFYGAEAPGVGTDYKVRLADRTGNQTLEDNTKIPSWVANKVNAGQADEVRQDFLGRIAEAERKVAAKEGQYWLEESKIKGLQEVVSAIDKMRGGQTASGGTLYKLDIPDADAAKFLDYDAPLSQQPKEIRDKFSEAMLGDLQDPLLKELFSGGNVPNEYLGLLPKSTGAQAYRTLADKLGSEEAASEALRKAGIPGLKYRDQMSRYDPDILPDNMIANEARKWLGQSDGDSEKAMKLFKDSNPRELYADREINEIEKVISTVGRKITRNYVTWDQDVLDRAKILERDGKPTGLLGN
jgi:hypothetical protein